MAKNYDVIVIGAGPGGYVAAIRCAQLGLSTAIVEKDAQLGGTCLLRGCIPTKALLESAHLYTKISSAKTWGIKVTGASVDFAEVQKYREKTVNTNSKGVDFLMRKNKIDVLKGHGRLVGRDKVSVTDAKGAVTEYPTKNVILATGSACKDLPFIEMDHVRTVNSDDILEIQEIPKSLIVMGAGAVGTEFASVYEAFGSKVTIVEYMDRLLPMEDADASAELQKAFKRRGIESKTASKVTKVELVKGGVKVHVEPRDGGAAEVLDAAMLLVAVGRAAVTWDLGLETTSIRADERGIIPVDGFGRTAEPNIFAIGDIVATPMLAHTASHEGVLAAETIAGLPTQPINHGLTPSCTYTSPEVASVGLSEQAAKDAGYDVKVGNFSFGANGKARIMGEADGFVKLVVDTKYNEILGAHIVGPKATELISEMVVAIGMEATVEEVAHAIHPHPTLAEAVGEAAIAALNGAPLNS